MQRKNCGQRMKTLDLVTCLSKAREARKLDDDHACPDHCAPIYEPLCDSDGDVHYNECFFRKAMCENGIHNLNEMKVRSYVCTWMYIVFNMIIIYSR